MRLTCTPLPPASRGGEGGRRGARGEGVGGKDKAGVRDVRSGEELSRIMVVW